MRRRTIRATKPDGTPTVLVRLEPETPADLEEVRRLKRARLLDTDENQGDVDVSKRP